MAVGRVNIGGGKPKMLYATQTYEECKTIYKIELYSVLQNLGYTMADSQRENLDQLSVDKEGKHLYVLVREAGIIKLNPNTGDIMHVTDGYVPSQLAKKNNGNCISTLGSTLSMHDVNGKLLWDLDIGSNFNRIHYSDVDNLIYVVTDLKLMKIDLQGNILLEELDSLGTSLIACDTDDDNIYVLTDTHYKIFRKSDLQLISSNSHKVSHLNSLNVKGDYVYLGTKSTNNFFQMREKYSFDKFVFFRTSTISTSNYNFNGVPILNDKCYVLGYEGIYLTSTYAVSATRITNNTGSFPYHIVIDNKGGIYTFGRDCTFAKFEHLIMPI